jgi:putative sterol carrier protein
VKDAATVLSRAFDFLGLEPDPTIATAVFSTKHESGPGDPKAEFASRIYGTSIGKGAEIIPLLAEVSPTTKNKLERLIVELGYPPIDLSNSGQDNWSQAVDSAAFDSSTVASVEELFRTHFPARLQQRSDLKGSVKFLVKGSGGGAWTLNFAQQPVSIEPMNQEADCTITIRSEDLIKLATGELNVGECYLQAKLRVTGDEAIAVSLGRALFS